MRNTLVMLLMGASLVLTVADAALARGVHPKVVLADKAGHTSCKICPKTGQCLVRK